MTESYLNGAYRRHRIEDVERYTALATDAFPEFLGRLICFGADWLGRQFATDSGRVANGQPQVLLLEPGSGEAFEIPVDRHAFHETELSAYPNEVVEFAMFQEWVATGGVVPTYDQCVGYKKPLFLSGEHKVPNLEIGDFEVYWSMCGQLLAQVRGLPEGTAIGKISID